VTSWTPRCSHTTRIDLLILPLFLSRSFSPNHLSLFHPWVPGPFVPHPPFTPASVLAAQLPESLLSRLLLAAAAGEPESEPAPHRLTSPRPPTTCRHCPYPDWTRTRRCATLRQVRTTLLFWTGLGNWTSPCRWLAQTLCAILRRVRKAGFGVCALKCDIFTCSHSPRARDLPRDVAQPRPWTALPEAYEP
jgi:hypothetical protein